MKALCALAMLAPILLGARGWPSRGPGDASSSTLTRRTTEPSTAQQPEAPPPGQEDFDRVCKVCHGAEARGDAGPRLVPFTREYDELLAIVREGSGQMPPISARQLPDEGVARILAYLKFLSR
jgi:mono/diheme cytochrome c family protein